MKYRVFKQEGKNEYRYIGTEEGEVPKEAVDKARSGGIKGKYLAVPDKHIFEIKIGK